jgi:hypothetical protein
MNGTTVAVDLAKPVFQLAVADSSWKPGAIMANRVHPTLQYADNSSGLTNASSAAACSDWHFSDADSFGATGHS